MMTWSYLVEGITTVHNRDRQDGENIQQGGGISQILRQRSGGAGFRTKLIVIRAASSVQICDKHHKHCSQV